MAGAATWVAGLAGTVGAVGAVELVAAWPRGRGRHHRRPLTAVLVRLGRGMGPVAPRDMAARLEAAGLDGEQAGDAMAVKVGAAMVGGVLALLLGGGLPGRLGLVASIAGPLVGFLAPDAMLRRQTRARGRALARELPDTLDLLRVAVQAGLPPARAMAEVGARATGILALELRQAARRRALGEPVEAALDRLAARCPLPAVALLVAGLRRAERHGAPLAGTLGALAEDARAERARTLKDHAARAAPKIQLVVALALVPGVLLLVAAVLLPQVA